MQAGHWNLGFFFEKSGKKVRFGAILAVLAADCRSVVQ
jgi:hypothetical protein